MKEEWKSLNGLVEHGEYYEVSNFGNVRSIDRKVKCKNDSTRIIKGKLLSSNKVNEYLNVYLWKNNKVKKYFVHRLVALAFIPNPNNFNEVNHIDECKENNNVSNLEWCTREYNQKYGTRIKRSAEKHRKPINVYKYPSMEFIGTFESGRKASEFTKVSYSNIPSVCNGKYKQLNGYYFEYAQEDDAK